MKNCRRPPYKKLKSLKSGFIKNSNFENNRDPCFSLLELQNPTLAGPWPCRHTPCIPLDRLGSCRPNPWPLLLGLPLDPLGPFRPTPWPPRTFLDYPLTPWDPEGLPLDLLGPFRPNHQPPATLCRLTPDLIRHLRPTPWPPGTVNRSQIAANLSFLVWVKRNWMLPVLFCRLKDSQLSFHLCEL